MHVETYLNVDLSSSAQVKIQVKFNFELKKKKVKFFGSHVVVLVKTFRLTYQLLMLGLILTKPGRFLFSANGNSGYEKNSISSILNFLKTFHIFGFPGCSTCEDHSIDVSITNVGLILTKLR